jgi:prephenate dehydratase
MPKRIRVAFQGEPGAYSEQAVYQHFGPTAEPAPYPTLGDVFQAVEEGRVDYGVVPVENSLEGGVNETYDLLLQSSLKVRAEIELRIIHCLIGHPGTRLEEVEVVYSHPQALGQCRGFLRRLGVRQVPIYDTAGGVKMVWERGLKNAAAIASKRAAEIYGMMVLAEGIEDHKENYTRFFVLGTADAQPTGRDKTSLIFALKDRPGALYHALEVFATRQINLTKIQSRPTRRKAWEYNFYLDLEGHRLDPLVDEALKELNEKAIFVKILGSYPRANQ